MNLDVEGTKQKIKELELFGRKASPGSTKNGIIGVTQLEEVFHCRKGVECNHALWDVPMCQ